VNATPSFDLIAVFLAVAEKASFSAAATQLNVPRSTVSRGVTRLEASLGTQLFHRTTHTVGLTAAGAALLERTAPLMSSLRTAINSLPEATDTAAGELRIAAPLDFATVFLSEAVQRFTQRYPRVRVSLRLSNAYVDLVSEGIDLAFRVVSTKSRLKPSLVARKLMAIELQMFASPAYVDRRGKPALLSSITDYDFVGVGSVHEALRLPVDQAKLRFEADEFLIVRDAVVRGAGLAVLPSYLVRSNLRDRSIVRVLPEWSVVAGSLFVVHPAAKQSSIKSRLLKKFIVEELAASRLAGDVPSVPRNASRMAAPG
jgi:DNA-binding transcriptional LysR family regulator